MYADYFFGRSLSSDSSWGDLGRDLLWFLGSMCAGVAVYFMFNGSPFAVVTLDVSDIDTRKEGLCYTEEEAKEKYGPDEGQVFADDVQVCGQKLPKRRALRFMKLSGEKVARIFNQLSYEEKHALMIGSAVLPEDVMRDSLSDHWRGSGGKTCNGCKREPRGNEKFAVCGRCQYAACAECHADKKLGTCYCKDENFGIPYPAPSRRKFYQKGVW
eukprot:jgi/Ulvmu1/3214/UM015_0255.1